MLGEGYCMSCEKSRIKVKKICFVASIAGTFWAFYSGLIKRLKELSVDVTIVTSDDPRLREFEKKLGCRIFPVEIARKMSPFRDLLAILRLARHLRREKYCKSTNRKILTELEQQNVEE